MSSQSIQVEFLKDPPSGIPTIIAGTNLPPGSYITALTGDMVRVRTNYNVSLKNLPLDMKPLECWLEKK